MTLDGSASSDTDGTITDPINAGDADTSDWPIEGHQTNWSSAMLAYYAIDPAGNQEATQAEDLE